ncbi:MAG: TIGR00375 family protein [Methanosarcinales archaeon]|nr:TIGR00375 family protein [ANME-2 cluster archaeon]MDF1530957.1 TIGR00375 family protein [ANME-2 cluster archaeon]MDW7775098.1 TIGR00375 family protein [Methanosarcinales archaeon]
MSVINADLHIHSKYSMATSNRMDIPTLAVESVRKGIQLVGTGDCLHSKWLDEIKTMSEVTDGIYGMDNARFVLTTELEDTDRVHHLLIIPDISKAEELREAVEPASVNIDTDGRPNVNLSGVEIAELAREAGAMIGPAHAFTPWTAMYASHDSLESCYGELAPYISFVELGLSADTDLADRISELHRLTFLTNSDAHSPWPNKLAREFTRFRMEDITFGELEKAILRQDGRGPVMNVGLFPQEGKYHESACIRCFRHYTLEESRGKNWRCTCGGRIKKGVCDRVEELADSHVHPAHRPPYLHLVPLSEIIMMALGTKSTTAKKVRDAWELLVDRFGSEVTVLLDAELDGIKGVEPAVIHAVRMFREGKVRVIPGGGGQYGSVEVDDEIRTSSVTTDLDQDKESGEIKNQTRASDQSQRSLTEF